MQNFDAYKFQQEIKKFKQTVAPSDKQWNYLNGKKSEAEQEILKTAKNSKQSVERCLLTAICGTFGTPKEQQEFVSRLILIDLLAE